MVGKVAVVPIVLSVAVDVAGGESVRNCLNGGTGGYVVVVAAVRVVVVHVAPRVEAAAVVAVLTVIVLRGSTGASPLLESPRTEPSGMGMNALCAGRRLANQAKLRTTPQ